MSEVKTEVKEITSEELRTFFADALKELVPGLKEEIKNDLKSQIVTPDEEDDEEKSLKKAAAFIKSVKRSLRPPVLSGTPSRPNWRRRSRKRKTKSPKCANSRSPFSSLVRSNFLVKVWA
jgi:hypothetical protein